MASSPSSLVFITYSDNRNGRNHDSQRRQIVRKQAFHFSRAKVTHGPNIGRKRVAQGANLSPRQNVGGESQLEDRANRSNDVRTKVAVPHLLPDRPSYVSAMGPDVRETLDFYHRSQRSSPVAINPDGDDLAFTISDATALRAHLYSIATNMESEGHPRGRFLSAKFKTMALNAVGEGLRGLSGPPDNYLIYAVAILGNIESISGERASADAHYKGLLRMIALRGGIPAFSEQKRMMRTIFWSRRCHCLRWHDILGLPAMPPDTRPSYDPVRGDADDSETAGDQDGSDSASPPYGGVISRELVEIAGDFRALAKSPAQTPSQRRWVSDTVYEVEYKLLLLAQKHLAGLSGMTGLSVTLSTAYHLAAQLYVFMVLREVPARTPIVARFSATLRAELEGSNCMRFVLNRERLSGVWQRLLLWVEALLALGLADPMSRQTSLALLALSAESLELDDFAAFRRALGDVAWMDGVLEDELLAAWDSITALRSGDAIDT